MTTVGKVEAIRLGRQRSPGKSTGRYATKYLRPANLRSDGSFDLNELLEMDFLREERLVYSLRAGDILLADSSGSASHVGRAAVWRGQVPDCCYQNHLIRFRSFATLPDYAILVFGHYASSGAFAAVARGVGILHLGASRFAQMPFPLPPIGEQKRIAEEAARRLRELSQAEGSLQSALGLTRDQDRAILSAAVTGQLVESEATLAARNRQTFESASDALASLKRRPAKRRPATDTSLFVGSPEEPADPTHPDLPEGWAFVFVGDVGEVRLGRQRSPKRQHGEYPTPYLRAANITAEGLDLSEVLQMNFTPEERLTFELHPGDVVLAEASGSPSQVGRPSVWNGEIPGCCYQNTVVRFRSSVSLPSYSFLVFRYYSESGIFGRAARGIGIQHLGVDRFVRLGFPLPPMAEQMRIVDEAESRLMASAGQREAILSSLNRLSGMRTEILAAATRGELVGQMSSEESADALLARLGPAPKNHEVGSEPGSIGEVTSMGSMEGRGTSERSALVAVIRGAGRALSVPEVFAMAGYDRDSTSDVETFYLVLRTEFGASVQQVGDKKENALLRASDAT